MAVSVAMHKLAVTRIDAPSMIGRALFMGTCLLSGVAIVS
jgi:hypothetical protein